MDSILKYDELELAVVIVDFGIGSRVLKLAKLHGIHRGIVFVGKGTLNNRILEFLRLADVRKEIVLMVSEKSVIESAMNAIYERFRLDKPFHGIAYTRSLNFLAKFGLVNCNLDYKQERNNAMYQSIMVVVERGKAEQVMETASKAGAHGGTILKARSAADSYDNSSLLSFDIEPERDVVLILVESAISQSITDAIRNEHVTDSNDSALIVCQDVNRVYGLK